MLDFLRKRRRSWIIVFFLGLIIVSFVLFLGGIQLFEPPRETIGEVNGEAITAREFEIHYQRLLNLYRNVFRGSLTPELIQNLGLRGAVLEELVERRLVLQEARRLGLKVSDEELIEAIARVPDFQVDGRFSKNRYLQILRLHRLTPEQFEEERREALTVQKLYDLVHDSVQLSEAELEGRYRLENEKIELYFVRLSAGDFLGQVKVSEEEIKSYYEKNRESFREPLKLQVEYLVYPLEYFFPKIQVSEREVKEYYERYRDTRFREPPAVRLRHILVRVGAEKEKARAKAESALREARAGRDFGELAKKLSEDPSAPRGGDIGWLSKGQLLPPLDRAAFALKKGEVSDVVETSLGYHILKAEDVRAEKTKSLEEARGEIVRAIRAERGRNEALKAADSDREKALSGTSLSQLAKERGLVLRVSPFFSRFEAVEGVGQVEEFNKTAFSLGLEEVSPPVEGPKGYYLLKVAGRKEPSIPAFEQLRSEIERRLKERKASELAAEKARSVLESLKKEGDIRRVAREHGLKLEETGQFPRGSSEIPKVGALQELKPGGIPVSAHKPVPDRVYTQAESHYVFAFKGSQAADMAQFEKEKARLAAQLLSEKRQKALRKFLEGLKAKSQVKLKAEFLGQ